jgi:hypothetical protein
MFDLLMICNKLGSFSFATQLFDKYLSIKISPSDDYALIAAACIYIAQIKFKYTPITVNSIVKSVNAFKHCCNIGVDDINNMILSIMRVFNYRIYLPTFEIMVLRHNLVIDMKKVLQTHLQLTPPYNNAELMRAYNQLK